MWLRVERSDSDRRAVQREPPGRSRALGREADRRHERQLAPPCRQQRLRRKRRRSRTTTRRRHGDNSNGTWQTADQKQSSPGSSSCGCSGGTGIQVLGQEALNGQAALAASGAVQDFGKSRCGCSSGGNSNDPLRVWSLEATVLCRSRTPRIRARRRRTRTRRRRAAIRASPAARGPEVQVLGQEAKNGQLGAALSGTFQIDPSNRNGGARVYSPGTSGAVDQSNDATSTATADNTNHTMQDGTQSQYGSPSCGCGSDPQIQVLGQSARNLQAGFASRRRSSGHRRTRTTSPQSRARAGRRSSRAPRPRRTTPRASTGEGSNDNLASQLARQSDRSRQARRPALGPAGGSLERGGSG